MTPLFSLGHNVQNQSLELANESSNAIEGIKRQPLPPKLAVWRLISQAVGS